MVGNMPARYVPGNRGFQCRARSWNATAETMASGEFLQQGAGFQHISCGEAFDKPPMD